MNKGLMISYFDKMKRKGIIATGISALAREIGVHRNTISAWLAGDNYFDTEKFTIFCIDPKDVLKRKGSNNIPRPIKWSGKNNAELLRFIDPKPLPKPQEGPIHTKQDLATVQSDEPIKQMSPVKTITPRQWRSAPLAR